MKNTYKLLSVISLLLIVIMLVPTMTYASGPDNPKKPDKNKPVDASNVVLVKKITVKTLGSYNLLGKPVKPPSKNTSSATGQLGATVTSGRYAIVIGINNYPGTANDLQYCVADAVSMRDALIYNYGFTVNMLTDSIATRGKILTAIDNIPADTQEVVFYFSGHGSYGNANDGDNESRDESIVVCNNDNTNYTYIWDGELKAAFADCPTSRVIFVFDSCLSGGMNDLAATGRVLAMASTETGYSWELSSLGHGEFTYYFVTKGMQNGLANVHDYDNDTKLREPNQVTVEEAFDYAKANCKKDKPTIGDYFPQDLLP